MAEPFIGEIRMFGFTFAPNGWALCNGQLLPIAQNTALFSLLGTTYGGDGRVTFGLPNLQGRVPIHFGQGPGLSPYAQGQAGGVESVTLNANQMPPHVHSFAVPCNSDDGSAGAPKGNFPGSVANPVYSTSANATMGPGATAPAGGGQPFPVVQPYLTVNFCIALVGIYPSRP